MIYGTLQIDNGSWVKSFIGGVHPPCFQQRETYVATCATSIAKKLKFDVVLTGGNELVIDH